MPDGGKIYILEGKINIPFFRSIVFLTLCSRSPLRTLIHTQQHYPYTQYTETYASDTKAATFVHTIVSRFSSSFFFFWKISSQHKIILAIF
jgi:hypothetical protein